MIDPISTPFWDWEVRYIANIDGREFYAAVADRTLIRSVGHPDRYTSGFSFSCLMDVANFVFISSFAKTYAPNVAQNLAAHASNVIDDYLFEDNKLVRQLMILPGELSTYFDPVYQGFYEPKQEFVGPPGRLNEARLADFVALRWNTLVHRAEALISLDLERPVYRY